MCQPVINDTLVWKQILKNSWERVYLPIAKHWTQKSKQQKCHKMIWVRFWLLSEADIPCVWQLQHRGKGRFAFIKPPNIKDPHKIPRFNVIGITIKAVIWKQDDMDFWLDLLL